MIILKAKLLALKKAEERAHLDELRGDVQGSWGDQMRNYVLHPYQLVKDLRTEYESGNPQAVFDGDIDAVPRGRHPLAPRRGQPPPTPDRPGGTTVRAGRRPRSRRRRTTARSGAPPSAAGTSAAPGGQLAGEPGVAEQPAQGDRALRPPRGPAHAW